MTLSIHWWTKQDEHIFTIVLPALFLFRPLNLQTSPQWGSCRNLLISSWGSWTPCCCCSRGRLLTLSIFIQFVTRGRRDVFVLLFIVLLSSHFLFFPACLLSDRHGDLWPWASVSATFVGRSDEADAELVVPQLAAQLQQGDTFILSYIRGSSITGYIH